MNRAQRTVLVIAIGLAVATVVIGLNRSMRVAPAGGWFSYAPNGGVVVDVDRSVVWREALVWLVGIAAWVAAALLIYRRDSD